MPAAGHTDWWAGDAHRARFRILAGNWTTVTDKNEGESHQFGSSFLVSFVEPGGASGASQGLPGVFSAAWSFEAPAGGLYRFSTTAVDAHFYPLTDAAVVCVREQREGDDADCIASGTIDQRAGIRDGRWVELLASAVPLRSKISYDVTISWDPTCSGYVAADALLVESEQLYNGKGALANGNKVVIGAMDARIVLKG
jgi:hypothetical protein